MLSQVLRYKTPTQTLLNVYSSIRILSSILIKVFGCIAFVHVSSQYDIKLDPKSIKCIFIVILLDP